MFSYKPQNILVTGAAGFIASHVSIELATIYPSYNVISFDKCDYCSSIRNLEKLKRLSNHKFIKGDILDANFISYLFQEHSIDTVLHLAAQSHVDNSFGNSLEFTRNNVLGTHVLLECAKQYGGLKRFIHISTDEVYGEIDVNQNDATESSLLNPTNPYAATKAGAEFLVKAYHQSFKLPIIITRGNNVYGPHQYPEKLIPKFICRLLRGQPCCIHGEGQSKRMFLYVKDVAHALITIMHKGKVGETYNVGCDDEKSVLEVAETLINLLGIQPNMIDYVQDRHFNDCRYAVDTRKLQALGWRPRISWEDGIRETINWYKANLNSDYWPTEGLEHALTPHPTAGQQSGFVA